MGVEDIIAVIAREAEEEAARILAEAERRADELVADAESEVRAQIDAAIERQGPAIRAASQRRVNAVRLRILEERAHDDAARLTAVFDAAEERVAAIADGADRARWSTALSVLCEDALGSVGEPAVVRLRARDVEAISSVADAWRAEVVPLPGDEEPGLTVSSRDARIEVDARLSVRMERGRSLLAEAVAQRLHLRRLAGDRRSAA